MRTASPPRQIERENEMIVISQPLSRGSSGIKSDQKPGDIRLSRIVIESVAEKSFLQSDKRRMCESRDWEYQVTGDLNTTFGHHHHLYSATLPCFYALHHHSSSPNSFSSCILRETMA